MDRLPGTAAPASLVASPSYVRAVLPAARAVPTTHMSADLKQTRLLSEQQGSIVRISISSYVLLRTLSARQQSVHLFYTQYIVSFRSSV